MSQVLVAPPSRALVSGAVCVAAASISALLYAPYGYNGLDDGFIQALSWRVANGQLPYLDFVYVRPPGSVLLHALPLLILPPGLQVIFERWWFFLSVAACSFLAAAILTRAVDVRAWKLPRHALALLFFVASVQDFPPMPWHTLDGIFLAVLAAFFVCCTGGTAGLVAGAVLAVLSASCKQPFALVPIATLAYVVAVRGRTDGGVVAAVMAATVAAAAATLAATGILGEALRQCTAETRLMSLVHAGFLSYARGVPMFIAVIAGWWLLTQALRRLGGTVLPPAGLAYALVLWIFGSDIAMTLMQRRFQTPAYNYPGALFLLAALAFVATGRPDGSDALDRRGRAALALLLSVSWCASVSWGYPTPILFSAPLWFGALLLCARRLGATPRRVVLLALPLALTAQFTGYQFPYREAPRRAMTAALGESFDRLSHVYTSPANRARFDELRTLAERYPLFTVLPALPSAHYLTGAVPPIGVDWARNSEAGGRTPDLIRELEASRAYVFLERAAEPLCERGAACSELARHVAEGWPVVEEGEHFRVHGRRVHPVR